MKVLKRNNTQEEVSFDKILNRVKIIGKEFNVNINYSLLVMKVIDQLFNGIPTKKIDELTAEQCAAMSTQNPDYGTLASIIVVSNHQKSTPSSFREVVEKLYNFKDVNGVDAPLVSKQLFDVVMSHHTEIEQMIDYKRDFLIDYFGFKTLERAYLFRVNKTIVERIQHMWMRVSVGIHGDNLEKVKETYDLMSQKYFTHATPTLYNAGTPRPQLSSCYLLAMESDSIDGIYNTVKDCAKISKWAGGIGLHIHNVRGTGSHIRGTNGTSNGIVPMLRVFNMTARYVDQCVTPETIIYTTQGPIEIQNCSFGETQIYNLKGEVETIENVLEHYYSGEILKIKTTHGVEELNITPEHPVFAFQNREIEEGNVNWTLDDIENKLNNNIQSCEWIDAQHLTINDLLVYKIPTHSVDIKQISEDDCYMYGIILGYGSMTKNNGTGSEQVVITLTNYQNKNNYISNFIINYLENKCIEYKLKHNNDAMNITWKKSIVIPFRYSDFYDSTGKSYIHSKWLNLPVEKSKFIIKGLLCGNLHVINPTNYYSIQICNNSKQIIESARFICLKMGILTSGYSIQSLTKYYLDVPKTAEILDLMDSKFNGGIGKLYLRHNDLLLCRIENILKSNYSGILYDLQMKDEHNYMIHNGIIHNGGGKRNGSFAIYLEPWHTDIVEFLELRKNHGEEEMRCRDLFLALWTPDLFMERVKTDGNWSLFCPDQCPGLSDSYGDDFNALYAKYESQGCAVKTMKARTLWFKILDAQMETGTPYILFKDAANKKSNQKNLGVIKSSNLCTEIMEYSSNEETAVCNLASIALTKFVGPMKKNIKRAKIYTKTTCGYCTKSKNLLKLNNILYDEINLDNDEERLAFYQELSNKIGTNVNTVPQIYLDDEYVGGYDALVETLKPVFHYDELHRVTKVATENLNKVIDVNYYPTDKTLRSNMLHRPIGLGVQGLADAFFKLDIPFHSEEAANINKNIFETIYHAALEKSMELSIEHREKLEPLYDYFNNYTPNMDVALDVIKNGQLYNENLTINDKNMNSLYHSIKPVANELFTKTNQNNPNVTCRLDKLIGSYSSFVGSPASNGILQFDMWNVEPTDRYNWNDLKQKIVENGIRNSLLVAPMPTASTSQILGNNECFEPITSNIYSRRTIAGEFVMVNKYLMYDLMDLGFWNEDVKNNIIANQGSVQQLTFLSQHLKDKYKIVWEMPMKHLIDMSRDRGAFVCQSQSLNLWVEDPDYKTLTSMHFYSHQAGLKTGIYYLRRKPKHTPQQFTIVPDKKEIVEEQEYEICEMCSG
jgi:ribonucleotide reductase alpha subunit